MQIQGLLQADQAVPFLSSIPTLRQLRLDKSDLTDSGYRSLCRRLGPEVVSDVSDSKVSQTAIEEQKRLRESVVFDFRPAGRSAKEIHGLAYARISNATPDSDGLAMNGLYEFGPEGARASKCRLMGVVDDAPGFSLLLVVRPEPSLQDFTPLLVSGSRYRGLAIEAHKDNRMSIMMSPSREPTYAENVRIEDNAWVRLAAAFDFEKKRIRIAVNGQQASEIDIPESFQAQIRRPEDDTGNDWGFSHTGRGSAFQGIVNRVLLMRSILPDDVLVELSRLEAPFE